MKGRPILGFMLGLTVLSTAPLMVTGEVKPAIAQTEVPANIRYGGTESTDGFILMNITVPNQDTTRSAYGGQLRFYDVHFA